MGKEKRIPISSRMNKSCKKTIMPFNVCSDDTCRTLKAQYGKNSVANFVRQDGLGATAVIELLHEEDSKMFMGIYDNKRLQSMTDSGKINEKLISEPKETEYKGVPIKAGDVVDTSHSETFGVHIMNGVSPAIRSERPNANAVCVNTSNPRARLRKLTPREVFRLMDVSDEDIDKIQAAGISKTQQYKLAGNSIVVSCLYHLFRKLFAETDKE